MRSIILSLVFICSTSWAGGPSFPTLTQDDFQSISKDLSANFAHPSVMGAASLGKIFGVEASVVGGMTPSPRTDSIVKRSAPGASLPNLYNAGVAAALTVPFGITGEVVLLPHVHSDSADVRIISLGAKLTLSDFLLSSLPFNLAVRGFSSFASFEFDQSSGGINGSIKDTNSIFGLQLLASPKLPVFEPYVGLGVVKANNKLSLTGTGTLFSYGTSQSDENKPSSAQILLGLNVKLALISLGVEYQHAFGARRYLAKVGFAF